MKSDLRNKKTCIDLLRTQGLTPVTQEQGRAVARRMGAHYMECSSKELTGVDEIFDFAVNVAVGDEWRANDIRASNKDGNRSASPGSRMFGGRKIRKSRCKIL